MPDEFLSTDQLAELEALVRGATDAPWTVFAGPAIGGDDFICLGGDDSQQPDMYVLHDSRSAPVADLDFIAAARNYLPALIAEVRLHRST